MNPKAVAPDKQKDHRTLAAFGSFLASVVKVVATTICDNTFSEVQER